MLSSRPSYYPDPLGHHHNSNAGIEFYRRSDGGVRMPLGHNSSLLQDHYDSSNNHGSMSRRTTPSTENDGRHGNGPPRKRVPVACERCRKRKIKCSGDENGGGCSNCRNAGHSGCYFHRVATLTDANAYFAYHHQQRSRSHVPHWHHSQSHAHRYSPYSMPSASHHYNRQHPSYASYSATSPSSCPQPASTYYGSEYPSPYSSGASHNMSWTRQGSYPAYSGYENDMSASATGSANSYPIPQQPASFLLPNTNPIGGSVNTSYNAVMNPYNRSNSQVWTDPSLLGNNYGGQTGSDTPRAAYDPSLIDSATAQASVPYQLITNTNTSAIDRTLPRPGSRSYSLTQSSALENLPLSAVSHRSSIGWSTDSASNASHVSSQTSLTGGTPGAHEYPIVRSLERDCRDSQEVPYQFLGYGHSPRQNMPNNNLGVSEGPKMTFSKGSRSLGPTAAAPTTTDPSGSATQDSHSSAQTLPAHQQRCQTVSSESTPLQQVNSCTTFNGSSDCNTSYMHNSVTRNTNSNSNIPGDMPEPGTNSSTGPTCSTNSYSSLSVPATTSHDPTSARTSSSSITVSPCTSSENVSCSQSCSTATVEAVTTTAESSGSRIGSTHQGHTSSSDSYTAIPQLHPSLSFTRNDLVIPSPHSQTRAAAASGLGAARLTSASSGLSTYASARGTARSTSSMLSNFGHGGASGENSGYTAGYSQYGSHAATELPDHYTHAGAGGRPSDSGVYALAGLGRQDMRPPTTHTSAQSRTRSAITGLRSDFH